MRILGDCWGASNVFVSARESYGISHGIVIMKSRQKRDDGGFVSFAKKEIRDEGETRSYCSD